MLRLRRAGRRRGRDDRLPLIALALTVVIAGFFVELGKDLCGASACFH